MAHDVILDTNVLLNGVDLSVYNTIFLPVTVLEELDKIKHTSEGEKNYKARKAIKSIENADKIQYIFEYASSLPHWLDLSIPDNRTLAYALKVLEINKDAIVLSGDINVLAKCKALGIKCEKFDGNVINYEIYKGYKEIVLKEFEIASFYECQANKWNIKQNEYILIKNEDGEIIDKLKWTSKGFKALSYKTVDSRYVGKVKPRNLNQELYMDMLQDKESKVKIVQGGYGTGKDYLALANFLNMVEKGQYDKIIWIRNNIEAEGSKPIGYLPGTLTEKLSVYADIVGDFVGDKVGFEMLLNSGKLELVHTGFLRGRDLRNSIIYCTEAQNMSSALVKLILSRISDGSIVFFNGDIKQVDEHNFKMNNGLSTLINKLKGNPLFGYVYLNKCERSEVANLVSLMD